MLILNFWCKGLSTVISQFWCTRSKTQDRPCTHAKSRKGIFWNLCYWNTRIFLIRLFKILYSHLASTHPGKSCICLLQWCTPSCRWVRSNNCSSSLAEYQKNYQEFLFRESIFSSCQWLLLISCKFFKYLCKRQSIQSTLKSITYLCFPVSIVVPHTGRWPRSSHISRSCRNQSNSNTWCCCSLRLLLLQNLAPNLFLIISWNYWDYNI